MILIGIDIGGTKCALARSDETGRILERTQFPTPLSLQAGLDAIETAVATLANRQEIRGIGVSIGGPIDNVNGTVSPLHQPEWRKVPLKKILQDRFHAPCVIEVDVNAGALAEYRNGRSDIDRLMYLTISTGMGGGFVVNGRLYRGANGVHPEVGHQTIPYASRNPEHVECECGLPDCLEGLVSGNAIRRIYDRPAEELTDEEWFEVAYNLGQGLRNIATFYAPELIIIGGGVALGAGARLLDPAVEVMKRHLKLVPAPNVQLTNLGQDTALLGAVALAMEASLQ